MIKQANGTSLRGKPMEKFVVAYAKYALDKENGVELQGIFYGGLGDSFEEAEKIARECVNLARGGTILPRIERIEGEEQVISALYDATDKFEGVLLQMRETDDVLSASSKKKS